jgi:hypothetical protein
MCSLLSTSASIAGCLGEGALELRAISVDLSAKIYVKSIRSALGTQASRLMLHIFCFLL